MVHIHTHILPCGGPELKRATFTHTWSNLHWTSHGAAHISTADNPVVWKRQRESMKPEESPPRHSFTDTAASANKRCFPVHDVITWRTLINAYYWGKLIQIYSATFATWMSLINSYEARKFLSELLHTIKNILTVKSKRHLFLTIDELLS